MWRMFANIYLYLPLIFSNGVTRHVVEYDELGFQPEIICNAVCEEYLQISIYIYPLFYQMVSHDMLLSMINSNFSHISFVMLMWRCFAKLYLFLPLIFWNGVECQVVEYDELRFQPEFIYTAVWRMFANIYLYLHLSLSNGDKRDFVEYEAFIFQLEIICNAVCEECFQISIYFFP